MRIVHVNTEFQTSEENNSCNCLYADNMALWISTKMANLAWLPLKASKYNKNLIKPKCYCLLQLIKIFIQMASYKGHGQCPNSQKSIKDNISLDHEKMRQDYKYTAFLDKWDSKYSFQPLSICHHNSWHFFNIPLSTDGDHQNTITHSPNHDLKNLYLRGRKHGSTHDFMNAWYLTFDFKETPTVIIVKIKYDRCRM